MQPGGKLELTDSLKVYMEADDLVLVNRSKQRMSSEARLYFEIALAIATAFLGASISRFHVGLVWLMVVFICLSVFFAWRAIRLSRVGKLIELEGVFKIGKK